MAKTIAFLNPKGGTGKTTLCTNVARGLQLRGANVIIIDTDGQTSACNWREEAGENSSYPEVCSLESTDFIKKISEIESERDYILIDGVAQDMLKTAAAIYAADLVLTVLSPSKYDVWGAGSMMDMIEQRQLITDGVPMNRVLINKAIAGTKQLRRLEEAISEQNVKTLKSKIISRQVYPSTADGTSVFEEHNKEAVDEIKSLIDEILMLLEAVELESPK